MTKRKYKMEIFENATVQCDLCGRFFIRKMAHLCNKQYIKHHIKWTELKQITK
jgi:hypothetical protein